MISFWCYFSGFINIIIIIIIIMEYQLGYKNKYLVTGDWSQSAEVTSQRPKLYLRHNTLNESLGLSAHPRLKSIQILRYPTGAKQSAHAQRNQSTRCAHATRYIFLRCSSIIYYLGVKRSSITDHFLIYLFISSTKFAFRVDGPTVGNSVIAMDDTWLLLLSGQIQQTRNQTTNWRYVSYFV